jgi:hypothetical protein
MRSSTASLLTLLSLLLTGCGMGPRLIPSPSQGAAIQGNIHGGQQPVAGAHVYLFAAGTSGYGAASTSLLTSGDGSDSIGTYVLSDARGDFNLSGDYTCSPNLQVYALATGGDSGGGTNSAIGLMAVLGACPNSGNFSSIPFIEINEVSTIAAAFALSGYAVDSIHIADDEGASGNLTAASAKTGMANAFANAANLVDLGSGTALASTPAGNGTVPQATINTLANILASCVNSADLTVPVEGLYYSSACINLFLAVSGQNLITFTGYTYDTATAAIFIAHSPAANVDAIYTLPVPQAPFSPILSAEPSDFSLTLAFTPTQLDSDAIAFDSLGNLWYTYSGGGVAELTPLGAEAPGSPFADINLANPLSIAIDTANHIWTADYNNDNINEFSSSGSLLQTLSVTGLNYPTGIAIDPSGDLWICNLVGGSVTKTDASGNLINTYTTGLADPEGVLSDGSGQIWLPNPDNSDVVLLNNDGTPASNSLLGVSPAFSNNVIAAIDSSDNLWTLMPYTNSIGEINSSSVSLVNTPYSPGNVPPGGYFSSPQSLTLDGHSNIFASITYDNPFPFTPEPPMYALYGLSSYGYSLLSYNLPGQANALAADASGNLWYAVSGLGFYEIVGVAAPVVTPLAAAVTANKIATLP